MPRRNARPLLALLVLAAVGCSRSPAGSSAPPASGPAAAAPASMAESAPPPAMAAIAAPSTPSSPSAMAPHGGGTGERALSAEGPQIATGSIVFDLPADWRREQPSSGMRLAQAVVPGAAGPGELAVFHFGAGQGGSVESNFERWLGQVEQSKGVGPERGDFAANGFKVSWIEAKGTLLPSGMGSGPTTPQPGFRLLGAVVEGEGGPWFFKLTGPDATLAAGRAAFLGMLHAVHRP